MGDIIQLDQTKSKNTVDRLYDVGFAKSTGGIFFRARHLKSGQLLIDTVCLPHNMVRTYPSKWITYAEGIARDTERAVKRTGRECGCIPSFWQRIGRWMLNLG